MPVNYYDVLGISAKATKQEINEAYAGHVSDFRKALTRENKPSIGRLDLLRQAYKTLSDNEARTKYDRTLVIVEPLADASRSERLGGSLFDAWISMLYVVPIVLVTFFWAHANLQGVMGNILSYLAPTVGFILGFVLFHSYFLKRNGQTIGKKIVGIKIVRVDGDLPSLGTLIGKRYLPIFLLQPIPILGAVLALVDVLFVFRSDRRCVHDLIAGTRVVLSRPKPMSGFMMFLLIFVLPMVLAGVLAVKLGPSIGRYVKDQHLVAPTVVGAVAAANKGWCKYDTTEVKDVFKGCIASGPAESLGLSDSDLKFAQMLEQIQMAPADADIDAVTKLLGGSPDSTVADSLLIFRKNVPGEVRVYVFGGKVNMVRWMAPGKFMLEKKRSY